MKLYMNIICTIQRHIPGKSNNNNNKKPQTIKQTNKNVSCEAKGQSSFGSIHKIGQIV